LTSWTRRKVYSISFAVEGIFTFRVQCILAFIDGVVSFSHFLPSQLQFSMKLAKNVQSQIFAMNGLKMAKTKHSAIAQKIIN